jgi:hypothetical protein
MILKNDDYLEFVFTTPNGQEVSAFISISKIIESVEDYAYEVITTPECSCSSCAVEGFCECDPINEDVILKHVKI